VLHHSQQSCCNALLRYPVLLRSQRIPKCAIRLKADRLNLPHGAAVSSWADTSGNRWNATQTNRAFQPQFVAAALRNPAALRFDGADDSMDIAGTQDLFNGRGEVMAHSKLLPLQETLARKGFRWLRLHGLLLALQRFDETDFLFRSIVCRHWILVLQASATNASHVLCDTGRGTSLSSSYSIAFSLLLKLSGLKGSWSTSMESKWRCLRISKHLRGRFSIRLRAATTTSLPVLPGISPKHSHRNLEGIWRRSTTQPRTSGSLRPSTDTKAATTISGSA
jgi:hypothetical protein